MYRGERGPARTAAAERPETRPPRHAVGGPQELPGLAESRGVGDSAKMSDSATRRLGDSAKMSDTRLGDSGLTRAVTRPQGRVPQDKLRSLCSCAQASLSSETNALSSSVAATVSLLE